MSIEQYEAPTHEVDVPRQAGALALAADQTDWTEPQQAALAQLGIADAPKSDQQVFMHVAQRSGLDPFARQIYLIGRMDQGTKKWTIQTAIDGFRVIAGRNPNYAGQTPPQWCDSNGTWHDVWLNRTAPPSAARVGVHHREHDHVTWGVVHFWEFAGTKRGRDGTNELTKMWSDKSAHMIAKVAEATALRKAFPQDFSGLYIPEEMDAGETGPRVPMRAKAQRSTVSAAALTGGAPQPAAEPEASAVPTIDREQWTEITGHFKTAEVPAADRGAVVDWIVGREVGGMKNLTHDEAGSLATKLSELGPQGIAHAAGIGAAVEPDEAEAEWAPTEPDPWGGEAQ